MGVAWPGNRAALMSCISLSPRPVQIHNFDRRWDFGNPSWENPYRRRIPVTDTEN